MGLGHPCGAEELLCRAGTPYRAAPLLPPPRIWEPPIVPGLPIQLVGIPLWGWSPPLLHHRAGNPHRELGHPCGIGNCYIRLKLSIGPGTFYRAASPPPHSARTPPSSELGSLCGVGTSCRAENPHVFCVGLCMGLGPPRRARTSPWDPSVGWDPLQWGWGPSVVGLPLYRVGYPPLWGGNLPVGPGPPHHGTGDPSMGLGPPRRTRTSS